MSFFKNIIKNLINSRFYGRVSYAQEGEDLVIDRLIGKQKTGFYVDIGCQHPFRFSNTYFFYKRGWHGVCVDPMPGVLKTFRRYRSRDKVIEAGVARDVSKLVYYMFNEPALNTFDKNLADERSNIHEYKLIGKKNIPVSPLSLILEDSGYTGAIDLLSVDVEGFDLDVLQSNDWKKFRPKIVIAESLAHGNDLFRDAIFIYLQNLKYNFYAKTGNSLIFVDHKK